MTIEVSERHYASTGSRTVTIPTTGSATFTVTTTDDSADEPDGSVTATSGTATPSRLDGRSRHDDDPPPPTPPTGPPTVSVSDAPPARQRKACASS